MAEAALALYRSTAERHYLALAVELGEVIVRDHRDARGGFMVRQPEPGARGVLARPVWQTDENVAATRLLDPLARNTGRQDFRAAVRTYPTRCLRIEWLDRREGPLPLADVDYPEMPQAAAFACANGACSVPVFTPSEIHRIVAKVDDR